MIPAHAAAAAVDRDAPKSQETAACVVLRLGRGVDSRRDDSNSKDTCPLENSPRLVQTTTQVWSNHHQGWSIHYPGWSNYH